MTANRNLLRMKFARVIEAYAARIGCSLDEVLDRFYKSKTYELMRDGVSDMHCMSDEYLVDELVDEYPFGNETGKAGAQNGKACFYA